MEKDRNVFIQNMRGIGCLLILFFHYTFRYDQRVGNEIVGRSIFLEELASIGVGIFFLISAYFSIPIKRDGDVHVIEEFRRRIARLYPSYLVSIIIIWIFKRGGVFNLF